MLVGEGVGVVLVMFRMVRYLVLVKVWIRVR